MLEAAGLVVAVVQFVAEVGRAGEKWWVQALLGRVCGMGRGYG